MSTGMVRRLAALLVAGALTLPAAARAGERFSGGRYDRQIAADVNQKLRDDGKLRAVRATAEDGVVTLAGSVDRYDYKLRAEKKARKVKNVAEVRNQIAVRSYGISDAELYKRLASKLTYDRSTRGSVFDALTLEVRDGVATLGGRVRDDNARNSALAIAQSEKGVRGVVDRIRVLPVSIHDDDLRLRALRAIYGDPVLQRYALDPARPIRIVVENGHITLYGVVANRMDSQVAEIRAREVPGAFSVENRLIVSSEVPR